MGGGRWCSEEKNYVREEEQEAEISMCIHPLEGRPMPGKNLAKILIASKLLSASAAGASPRRTAPPPLMELR